MLRNALLAATLVTVAGSAIAAQSAIQISRSVYVERLEDGERLLEPASTLHKGDTVVLVMRWDGARDSRTVMLSSKIPATLAFQRSGMEPQAVSVDGGTSWGKLGTLRRDGRIAGPGDITDLRWRVPAHNGTLTYSAVVR